MDIKYKKSSAVLFIYLSGELDEYAANMSRSVLDKLLDENLNAGKVVFDRAGQLYGQYGDRHADRKIQKAEKFRYSRLHSGREQRH